MGIEIYLETLSLVLGLIGLIYVFGVMRTVNHTLYKGWNLILLAYIFFILAKLGRILEYANIVNLGWYKGIPSIFFIIFATLGVIYFSKETMKILIRKRK